MRFRIFLISALLTASAWAGIVENVRYALAQNNFAAAESQLGAYRSQRGVDAEYLEAYSWLGRAALDQQQYPQAAAYAKQAKMVTVQMQNKDGAFVKATLASFEAAASQADWKGSLPSMYLVLVDQPGKTTWPIAGASFILVQKDQQDAARGQAMMSFFDWAYKNGGEAAKALDYVPIPKSVYDLVESDVWKNVTVSGTPVWQ